jgi:hypothetical protein
MSQYVNCRGTLMSSIFAESNVHLFLEDSKTVLVQLQLWPEAKTINYVQL